MLSKVETESLLQKLHQSEKDITIVEGSTIKHGSQNFSGSPKHQMEPKMLTANYVGH